MALWRGWVPSVIGVVPYVGLNFAVYETLKDVVLQYYGEIFHTTRYLFEGNVVIIIIFIVQPTLDKQEALEAGVFVKRDNIDLGQGLIIISQSPCHSAEVYAIERMLMIQLLELLFYKVARH